MQRYVNTSIAIRMRKALGGGLRQVGVLAAAALYSLDHVVPRLSEDHAWAKQIGEGRVYLLPVNLRNKMLLCIIRETLFLS